MQANKVYLTRAGPEEATVVAIDATPASEQKTEDLVRSVVCLFIVLFCLFA
jgi:hypothetical protein